jgi:molecular chaperone HscC
LAKLSALKTAPRDEAENIALIARADRLYQQCLGAAREQIGVALAHFMAALEAQDSTGIRVTAGTLTRLLDASETPQFP